MIRSYNELARKIRFPSPCGVSFILIFDVPHDIRKELIYREFPSPCGVSFILMNG